MFQLPTLNKAGKQFVTNIYNNFNTHPNYIDYIISYSEEIDCAVINVTKEGKNVNMYRFYPDFMGNLGSISIYGKALKGHFDTINGSRKIFGLYITDIELVTTDTMEPFVDVTL